MEVNATIDAVGLYCPVPIILATEKMRELKCGEVLEILCDDSDSLSDFPAWCKSTENKFLKVDRDGGIYKFYIMKLKE
jgi:TusA-related sulfurtransferase